MSINSFSSIENLLKALKNKTNTNQFLQTITYELLLSINKENIDIIIEILELLFSIDPLLKNILYNVYSKYHIYHYLEDIEIAKHFNISYYSFNESLYFYDNLEKFIKNTDIELFNKQPFNNLIALQLSACIENCILCESVKILEYILQTVNKSILIYVFNKRDKELIIKVIHKGNFQMIDLIASLLNINFENINENEFIKSHSIQLITTIANDFDIDYTNINNKTKSLILHFINNNELNESIIYRYALSSFINKYDKNLIINYNCYNIIYERIPFMRFQFNDFVNSLNNNCFEIFNIVVHNFKFKEKHIRKINFSYLHKAILTNNIEFVKIIYNIKPILLNIFIRYYKKNNFQKYIIYDSSKKNLTDIIDYIKDKMKLIKSLEGKVNEIINKIFIEKHQINYIVNSNEFISIP